MLSGKNRHVANVQCGPCACRSFERLAPLLRAYVALALDTRFRLAEEDRRRFAPSLKYSTKASVKKMCVRSLTVESY